MTTSQDISKELIEVEINQKKFVCITTHLVAMSDINSADALFGGLLVQWVDEAAAIYVMELLKTHNVVTKKISEVIYNEPAHLSDVLELLFCVKTSGTTSITVECIVRARKIDSDDRLRIVLNCDLVFVKIGKDGRPVPHDYVGVTPTAPAVKA